MRDCRSCVKTQIATKEFVLFSRKEIARGKFPGIPRKGERGVATSAAAAVLANDGTVWCFHSQEWEHQAGVVSCVASACVGATFAALCFLVSLLLLLLLLLLLDMVFKALPAKTRFVFSVLRKPADRQT